MEQRNGRIDRKLQPSAEVYCHYFVYTDRKEDRILSVLVRKTELIKRELGSLSQVLEGRLARTLKHGIRHRDIVAMATELEGTNPDGDNRQVVEEELEEASERQEDLKAADPAAPESAQDLAGLACPARGPFPLRHLVRPANDARGPLETPGDRRRLGHSHRPVRVPRPRPAPGSRSDLGRDDGHAPAPTQARPEAVGMAAGIADPPGRLPRHRDHGPGRRPPPPGTPRRPALLGRFTAQGFVHHDLSRACLTQSNDAIPRVILMGRLCLYGPRAARLHEELVPVTARWTELSQRKKRL